jgi:hypothetical protein
MKNAPRSRAEKQGTHTRKRTIHGSQEGGDRIDAQELIELEKCQECPTMWMVADKSQETGVPGTHIGSGTVTCMTPAEAAVAPGAK